MAPLISVIIATRDRPRLFEEALDSVLNQRFDNFEVIVVNDGSVAEHLPDYHRVWARAASAFGPRFQTHSLMHRPKGHGSSYSLNTGASHAAGTYLCFLDDDDKWTDPEHLARIAQTVAQMAAANKTLDLYMANQDAWVGEQRLGTLWLGHLADELAGRHRQADGLGNFEVGVDDLIATSGFCHLNCFTVRRTLFNQVGGLDEGIRWENDRDFYLKLIDAAQCMVHNPRVMAYHRVPDPSKTVNITTSLALVEKRLLQALVLDRAVIRSHHPAIVRHARLHKGYALKKIAGEYAQKGDWPRASFYARQAQGATPGLKWWLFTLQCMVRSAMSGH
jgi:glycosyltransferase involved in cell wall biosynthesis